MKTQPRRHIRFYLKVLIALYETKYQQSLSYQAISDATGIATSTISTLATNQQKRVDLSVLARLCDFFGCELSNLMRLEPAEE